MLVLYHGCFRSSWTGEHTFALVSDWSKHCIYIVQQHSDLWFMLNDILTYISEIVYNNNCHSRSLSWLSLVLIARKSAHYINYI
jgi:hypothetical protein